MTKDRVLDSLRSSGGSYVSGGALSAELSLSRTAVWKAVEQLRAEGFVIESAPKKGYRLLSGGDALTESGVRAYLRRRDLDLRVYKSISSTNTVLKQLAESGEAEGTVLLAEEQTAGRGRMSRSFFSRAALHAHHGLRRRGSGRGDRGADRLQGGDQMGQRRACGRQKGLRHPDRGLH